MRLWLSKSSEVPLHEQITTQIMLGILSHDLPPGERLPSTRGLARRFQIHPNTVSAAYSDLARRGWVERRRGSGIYVRPFTHDTTADVQLELDQLISSFLQAARTRGYSLKQIQHRVGQWLELQPPDHFVVIEPDEELRSILISELSEATGRDVVGSGIAECTGGEAEAAVLTGGVAVAMYGQAERVQAALPTGTTCLLLRARSVVEALQGQERPPVEALIAVVSRWPGFLQWTRTMLVAAGVDSEALDFRDARERGWQKGLAASAFVITDAITAEDLPAGCRARVFRIIADASIAEALNFVEQFFTSSTSRATREL